MMVLPKRPVQAAGSAPVSYTHLNAYMTLYTALVTVAKAAAPMIPFMTEDIYQNLVRSLDKTAPESIHLCDFPEVKEEWINKDLEENMEEVLDVVVLGLSLIHIYLHK